MGFSPCSCDCFITTNCFLCFFQEGLLHKRSNKRVRRVMLRGFTTLRTTPLLCTKPFHTFKCLCVCVCLIYVSLCAVQFDKLRSLLTLYLSAENKRLNSILICPRDIQFMALTDEAMSNFLSRP